MKNSTKHSLENSLAILAIAIIIPSAANADQLCRSTDVNFRNDTGEMIKVYKFQYYDNEDQKWRNEVVSNVEISDGATSSRTNESLEYVGNEAITSFKVRYKSCDEITSNNNCVDWSKKKWSDDTASAPAINNCVKNINITIPVI